MAKQLVRPTAPPVASNVRKAAATFLAGGLQFDETKWEYSDDWVPAQRPIECHSIHEMVEFAQKNPKTIDIEAKVLCINDDGSYSHVKLNKEQFLETRRKNRGGSKRLREGVDLFALGLGDGSGGGTGGLLGNDFIPLIGGPYDKQLYYSDYIRMHGAAFFAKNHDPFGAAAIRMWRDFTIGRSFRIDSKNPALKAFSDAFCEVNRIYETMEYVAQEAPTYGEVMWWFLPNNETKIAYDWPKDNHIPRGIIPRVRLLDPSAVWDITTMPEDISLVLAYNYVAPTQYQIYSASYQGRHVPSLKFIFQQIPANEVLHFKFNCVSNEKRGRSALFPALGYMKRMRDTLNFETARLQKNAAWCIDTTVSGDQDDLNAYAQSQQELGTIPPAGSEFIHTKAIERKYLANEASGGQHSPLFEWNLSMIAVATGFPSNYYGTTFANQGTRAGAFVATEPVARMLDAQQEKYTIMLRRVLVKAAKMMGFQANDWDFEVSWPEIITQDRSKKFGDMAIAQANGWVSEETLGPIAGKELEIDNYDFEQEKKKISADAPTLAQLVTQPLTSPAAAKTGPSTVSPQGVTARPNSSEKQKVKHDHTGHI